MVNSTLLNGPKCVAAVSVLDGCTQNVVSGSPLRTHLTVTSRGACSVRMMLASFIFLLSLKFTASIINSWNVLDGLANRPTGNRKQVLPCQTDAKSGNMPYETILR